MEETSTNSKYHLKTLSTAFEILDELSQSRMPMGVAEISQKFGLQKSKVHRILDTLKHWEYVEQDSESRKYRLGTKVLELCNRKLESMDMIQLVTPYLDFLLSEIGETIHFGVLEGGKVLYLVKKQAPHAMGIISKVGQKLHAHCTGIGKVLLAHKEQETVDSIINKIGLPKFTKNTITDKDTLMKELEEIRKQGFSIDNEEISDGLFCMAAPVWNYTGEVIGAISVSIPTIRLDRQRKEDIKAILVKQSGIVSKRLGY